MGTKSSKGSFVRYVLCLRRIRLIRSAITWLCAKNAPQTFRVSAPFVGPKVELFKKSIKPELHYDNVLLLSEQY